MRHRASGGRIFLSQPRSGSYVTGEIVDYLTQDDMAQVEHGPLRYVGLPR
jgi:mRNA interferase MazF